MKRRAAPDPTPDTGLNEILAHRVAGFGLAAALVSVLTAAVFYSAGETVMVPLSVRRGAAEAELLDRLRELKAAWTPRERDRLTAEAVRECDRLRGALQRVLAHVDHPLAEPALALAGAYGDAALRPDVIRHARARRPSERAAAIRAAAAIADFDSGELTELLRSEDAAVAAATLEVLAASPSAPWPVFVDLLRSGDAATRERCLGAIPAEAPAELIDLLWTLADDPAPELQRLGLSALARAGATEDIERLGALLRGTDPATCRACLELLAATGAPTALADRVWQLVTDITVEPPLRVLALHCLEATGGADPELVLDRLFAMTPLERYFAARCLLAAGRDEGQGVLLDLVQEGDPEAVVPARQLLAWYTGRSPGSTVKEFEQALADRAPRARGPLPPHGMQL